MAYGIIKVDSITFTNGGIDQTVTVSGIVQSISGNITATGTIQGATIIGTSTVSGATVTGDSGQYGNLTAISGVYTTQLSGATITGDAGSFTTVTGGVATITSGVFALGTNSLPSISFSSDPDTGIYSPGADQLALSTSGTGKLFIDSAGKVTVKGAGTAAFVVEGSAPNNSLVIKDTTGNVGIGTTSPGEKLHVAGKLLLNNGSASYFDAAASNGLVITNPTAVRFEVNSGERARIDSSGRLLVGTSTSVGNGNALQIYPSDNTSIAAFYAGASSGGASFDGFRAQGSKGSESVVLNNNGLLRLRAYGYSDAAGDYVQAGSINFEVDGTPDSAGDTTDMPGRIVFSTTKDGSASPTLRTLINNQGSHYVVSEGTGFVTITTLAAGTADYLYLGYSDGVAGNATSGTYKYGVFTNGNVVNSNNSYGAISDIKLKENIVDAGSQWDDIKALRPVNYNFKEGQTHTQIGLIAQEVELVSPGLVSESPDRDAEGNDLGTVTKSVNYSVLYMKAVKALQEAMERIETLEAKVAVLESA